MKYKTNLILLILIVSLTVLTPVCALLAAEDVSQLPRVPETIEGAKSITVKFFQKLPQSLRESWQAAQKIWQKTWFIWWNDLIEPFFQNIWRTTKKFLGGEIEKRKPIIEKEFQKEKQEMKQEIKESAPRIKESIWQRFKELIK